MLSGESAQSRQLDRRRSLPEPVFITDRKHTDDFVIDETRFASGKFANVYHVRPKKQRLMSKNSGSNFSRNSACPSSANADADIGASPLPGSQADISINNKENLNLNVNSASSNITQQSENVPNKQVPAPSETQHQNQNSFNSNGQETLSPNSSYCAKIVRRRKAGKDLTSDIKHECSILQLAKEENSKFIIKLVQSYEQSREFQLILEYAPGEELWYHLIGQKHYSEATHPLSHYKRLMFEASLGLEWLHNHRIVHLDLKPSNIFLTSKVFVESKALIADFGLSRRLPERSEVKKRKSLLELTNSRRSKSGSLQEYKPATNVDVNEYGEVRVFAGTPDFCAPEVLRYDYIDLSADLFSLGCCYYIMLTGYSAFQADEEYTEKNLENQKTFLNIEQLQESYDHENFSDPLSIELIRSLLQKKASDRLTVEHVVSHAYFQCFRD